MTTVISKAIWESKTFWLGAVEILAGLAVLATDYLAALDAGDPVGYAFILKGAATIALRYFTKRPMTTTGGDPVKVDDAI
jgi:hypothetical protein